MPEEVATTAYDELAIEHWRTKWNSKYQVVREPSTEYLTFQIDPAWDFPGPVFEVMAEEFTDLVIDGGAYDETDESEYAGQFNGLNDFGPAELEFVIISADDRADGGGGPQLKWRSSRAAIVSLTAAPASRTDGDLLATHRTAAVETTSPRSEAVYRREDAPCRTGRRPIGETCPPRSP